MKKFSKSLIAASVLAASTITSGVAMAGASANVGVVSDYFFRGVDQGSNATASAGLDYDMNGFYIGTWVADVDDGLEYDVYAGYAGEFSGFSYDVGYYTYNYTEDTFDSTYAEVDLKVGYGPITVEYAQGTHDTNPDSDYTFTGITAEYNGLYATYGSHGEDFDGTYVEAGYGTEIGGFDAGIAIISADDDLNGGDAEMSMVFSLGKSFDL